MKPLMILILVFVAALVAGKVFQGQYSPAWSGRIAMTAMLLFTAVGHFVFTKGMSLMLPAFVPGRTALVYITGGLEIAAAVGLLIPGVRVPAAWCLVIFFALLLPANIHAALMHVDYQNATFRGSGPSYLWFRVPLQLFFIAWVYLSAVKA
ncbi:DoxX family protein [Niabella aurantiaca]|uniref:DoxX family protein n=1 Tax=Niabella aurantiaca TaxID=379900 RepID=UPI000476F0A6|nr:membrane protein [Niabella aurantiaca]